MPTKTQAVEILSTEASSYLAAAIAKQLGAKHRHTVRRRFSNGEQYYKIDIADEGELTNKDVVFVGATHTDDDLLELYRVGSNLAEAGTRRRIFIIPYFGYSTMERSTAAGEIVTAKTNAQLLSHIPNTNLGNVFVFLDLHKSDILNYFEGGVAMELSAEALLVPAIRNLKLKDFVIASADLGTPRQIQRLATIFKTDVAFIRKQRTFETTKVVSVVGEVAGKDVVIYDDMVRSGGSLIQATQAYKQQGAKRIYAATSHLALTNKEVVKTLKDSPIEKLIATNSHPASSWSSIKKDKFFEILTTAQLFGSSVRTILD